MVYKLCVVPQCTSTSIRTPQKLFLSVPKNPKRRRLWLRLARRDPRSFVSHSTVFMCEDHFDMEKDTINYRQYRMGFSQYILLTNEAVPTKFNCQEDRITRMLDAESTRAAFLKIQRKDLAAECLQKQSATETHPENLQENMEQVIHQTEGQTASPQRSLSRAEGSGVSRIVRVSVKVEPVEEPELAPDGPRAPHGQTASPQRSLSRAEGSGVSRIVRVSVKVEPVEEPELAPDGPRAPHESTRGNSCFTHFGHNTWDHTYATMDLPSIGVCVKQEPESNESADVMKEELADVIKEEGGEGDETAEEASGSAGARGSEAAMLAALYADHVVKDELVLGPEVPNQSHITSLHDARGVLCGAWREPRGGQLALKDCSVRLERCDAPRSAATREPAPESRAPAHGTAPHTRTDLNAANTYVCDICEKLFKRKYAIIRHVNRHLRENSEVLSNKSNIYKRVRASVKSYACDICNKDFATLGYLRRHQLDHPAPNTYVCDICGKLIKRKDHLIRHVNRHLRENSEVLSNKLNIYERVRASVKYACEICNKEFSRLDNLQRHQRVHTGDKPYSCEICNSKFAQIGNLKAHKRIHTREKPYSCDICNKQFAEFSTVSKHKRTHTREKSYSCGICKKIFGYFGSLKRHKLIHTGATPYTCEICEEGFMRVDTLKIHLKSHISGKSEIEQKKPRRKGQRNSS